MRVESGSVWPCRLLLLLLGIVIPLYLQHTLYGGWLTGGLVMHDTVATYIPLAQRFLQEGLALFASPDHLVVAPGSFLYMAALGADIDRVTLANQVLAALLLLLAFDTARRVAGPVAACAAAWLVACSPLLPDVLLPALSEPLHLLLIMLWLWTTSLIWTGRRHWGLVALGALALFLATLTRATYLYWIPAAAGASCLLLFVRSADLRQSAQRMLVMHVLALLLTVGWCAQNYYKFGVPVIANGSGAALYFGSNPAFNGYEPPYYGMLHDHWLITQGHPHLSIEGDRRLKQAAVSILREIPLDTFASMVIHKLGATLFFSQATLTEELFNQRTWRILMLVLAVAGLWGYRRSPFIWMLGCVLAYQLAIMTLVMHNARYSVGALEVPLSLASALGVAWLVASPFALVKVLVASIVAAVAVMIGDHHLRTAAPLMPMLEKGRFTTALAAQSQDLHIEGFAGDPLSAEGGVVESEPRINWRNLMFERIGGVPVVRFRAAAMDAGCSHLVLVYSAPGLAPLQRYMPLRGLQWPAQMSIGTLALNSLDPKHPDGTLSIVFGCPQGARLALEDLRIDYLTTGHHYRDLLAPEWQTGQP